MARPRAFEEDHVVAAAKELFWSKGYLATSVDDLEEATGLSRSSLYTAFGTKRELFDAALRVYGATFIDARLRPLEGTESGLREIIGYFRFLAASFGDPESQRGCLMINTITECSGRDPALTLEGEQFIARLRSAFANAMRPSVRAGSMTRRQTNQRAGLLCAAAVGAWVTARADPAVAASLCRSTAAQVQSWVPGPQ